MSRSLLPLTVLVLAAACSRPEPQAKTAPSGAPLLVQVETIAPVEITDVYQASGTVRARITASIAAKILGNIREVRVRAGERVEAGQVLVVLDNRDLEAGLQRAEAAQAEAASAIAEAEHAIAAAQANLDLARVTHRRFQDLLAKTSVSQQEFDESAARLKSAEAAIEMAQAKRRQAESRRSQTEAEVAAARVAAGYATLAAPFAGLVTERHADPGSMATPGAPLLLLEREGSLRLEASIDESRLSLLRPGQSVPVDLDGLNRRLEGRMAEIAPAVDPGTRTLTAKIDLPPAAGLRAGMFGRAAFPTEKHRALLAPAAAILERGQIQSVYVVEGDIARLRSVSLGGSRGGRREVLSGLSPGEKVIVSPPPAVADGSRVSVSGSAQ